MLKIRKATEQDAESLASLKRILFAKSDFFIASPVELKEITAKDEAAKLEEAYQHGGITYLVEEGHSDVGFLSFHRPSRKRLSHTGSFGMGILENCCNKGLGTKVIQHFLDWAKEQVELEKVCLGVLSTNNRAMHLYKKFGFEIEGRQKKQIKFEDGQYADDIIMSKKLI